MTSQSPSQGEWITVLCVKGHTASPRHCYLPHPLQSHSSLPPTNLPLFKSFRGPLSHLNRHLNKHTDPRQSYRNHSHPPPTPHHTAPQNSSILLPHSTSSGGDVASSVLDLGMSSLTIVSHVSA
jgi:hypothetical protein